MLRTLFVVVCVLAALLSGPSLAANTNEQRAMAEAAELIHAEANAHRLILLGEMHGTRETPRLVAVLATAYASEGPLLLGMEISASQAEPIRKYLASDGGEQARSALLADPYWHKDREHSDGRRNFDAIRLIEQIRRLKGQGRDVDILPFDVPAPAGDSQARDKAMADCIRAAFAKFPKGRMLALSGNVHAMLAKPSFAPPEMQDTMGSYLRDLDPYSVDIAARGGEFWACQAAKCGPLAEPDFRESSKVGDGTFDLRVVLPKFSVARLIEDQR